MNCPEAEIMRLMLGCDSPPMPEAYAAGRNRCYRVKWPDQRNLSPAGAEKYFDNYTKAFDYFERRAPNIPPAASTGPCNRTRSPLSGPSAGPGVTGAILVIPVGSRTGALAP
jgi:hypothetical protein